MKKFDHGTVPNVTVIVPTYRRAHLLEQTIPTYLQPEVARLILVDDCSPDNTPEVAGRLAQRDARVVYLRNEVNGKQTYSKNRALPLVDTEYVYFGDDDAMLSEEGIGLLQATLAATGADIAGAAALYLHDGETQADVEARRRQEETLDGVVNLSKLRFDWSVRAPFGLEVPVCHAAFLARTQAVIHQRFDEGYRGNCYREETDFLLACRAQGSRIVLDSRVTQTNLPPSQATGGARSRRLRYEWYAFSNTVRFLYKNRQILKQVDPRCASLPMLGAYLMEKAGGAWRKLRARLLVS
ncbi:glycosyltransferase family 2 protein [Kerstersia gyiorum]|jgi:glycosyltransferase involved in cell wall biosynthesis|uniref:glycosyltransferase family 2 protein n=1 Tax=Kerstersia gyiorum TaxID=206506 RepID=UPI00242AA2BF|nr:glycosyltransferase family 2 protein [Kerstersia gyiorum]MCH4273343.1 glycosyltransferase [Kerstersia gyiorum]MCI1228818.1 glycosyltransferase [Kerstersia gyiorum]